jgi:hypothetical protein
LKARGLRGGSPDGLLLNAVSSVEAIQDQPERIPPVPRVVIASYFENRPDSVPILLANREVFEKRREEEYKSKSIRIRRLYPKTSFYRKLVKCIHPHRYAIRKHELGHFQHCFLDMSEIDLYLAFDKSKELIEGGADNAFQQRLLDHFTLLGYEAVDNGKFDGITDFISRVLLSRDSQLLFSLTQHVGYLYSLKQYFTKVFDEVFNTSLPIAAYSQAKASLGHWLEEIQNNSGTALFIDAPMGLGKTHAIIKELRENPEISTAVFLPTKKLCEEFICRYLEYEPLKLKKESKNPYNEYFYVYGITPEECEHFDELVDIIKKKAGKKYAICKYKCKKIETCRFWTQYEEAKKYRIVVTTHSQYDRFYGDRSLQSWQRHKEESEEEEQARQRDVFVVDEDFILSKCYEPIVLTYAEFRAFVARFTEYLADIEDTKTLREKVIRFFGQMDLCSETSVIPRIDRRFNFSEKIKTAWRRIFRSEYIYDPDIDDEFEDYGNYIDALEIGMRVGAVVEKHGKKKMDEGVNLIYAGGVNRIHFPNPKSYDLSNAPPHVFIDGTLLDEKYIKRKIQGVELKKLDYGEIKLPWPVRIWQNENTDLSTKNIDTEQENVLSFVRNILEERGLNHKYFFLTSKSIREMYLDKNLEKLWELTNGQFDYVVGHYKSMRGMNEARDCDICIMLGSCIVSDALEIAMALPMMYLKLPGDRPIKTLNNLWTWKAGEGKREYKSDFSVAEEMALIIRSSEHRQGLARTRYLDKSVDFYILSRDRVCEYEPFFQNSFVQAPRYQFAPDLFKPQADHPRSKFNIVKEVFFELYEKYDKGVQVVNVHRKTGISRTTVKDHLDRLVAKGVAKRQGKKYFPVSTDAESTEVIAESCVNI